MLSSLHNSTAQNIFFKENDVSNMPRVIEPDDINIENISTILSSVGFNISTIGEAVWIEDENAISLKIGIDERDKMLKLESSIGLNDASPMHDKLKLADELNRALLVRFFVFSDGCLTGDYYLSYEHGVLTNQFILTCQLFQHIFVNVLREKFVKGGVLDIQK